MTDTTDNIAGMLDSIARLFATRAAIALEEVGDHAPDSENAYYVGRRNAYAEAADECRKAARHMRRKP